MSSVRLKKDCEDSGVSGLYVHTARCFEEYENKRAKIRRFTLQIHGFLHNQYRRLRSLF